MKPLFRALGSLDRRRLCLTLIVLTALLCRVGLIVHGSTYVGLQGSGSLWPQVKPTDQVHFGFGQESGSIARSIAIGKGFSSPFGGDTGPTAWIAPLYPYLLAFIFKLWGVFSQTSAIVILCVNSVFDALACIYIVRIGEKTLGRAAGWTAALVWASGFIFARWATTWVWDTSLSALLLVMAVDQTIDLVRPRDKSMKSWLYYALTWAVIALSNPSLLAVLPVCAVWIIAKQGIRSRQFWRNAVLASAVFCALITPWLIRNRIVFHRWVFIRSNAGFEFSLGNYPGSNGLGWFGRHPSQNKWQWALYKQQGELAYIAGKQTKAVAWVKQDPAAFLHLSAKRFYDFWYGTLLAYDPSDAWRPWMYNWLSLATIPGLWLAIRRGVRQSLLLASIVAFTPLPYYFTFTGPRYRHAVEPLMLIATTYVVLAAMEPLQRWRRKSLNDAAGDASLAVARPVVDDLESVSEPATV
jgi:Dolichyl-phosphate-mannose-protein mannosyltransferase